MHVQGPEQGECGAATGGGRLTTASCGWRGGATPASAVLGVPESYGLPILVQKQQGGGPKLTKGAGRSGSQCRGVDGEVWRRRSELLTWSGG